MDHTKNSRNVSECEFTEYMHKQYIFYMILQETILCAKNPRMLDFGLKTNLSKLRASVLLSRERKSVIAYRLKTIR